MNKLKLAILDMNKNHPNQGLRCIKEIADQYKEFIDWEVFDVRYKNEVPDLSFDLYISSGGPGSPLEQGEWKDQYFKLIDDAWQNNLQENSDKKYFFFICYSFQIVCEHFELGTISRRKSTSFGVFPVHKTKAGLKDPVLEGLNNPFHAVDSRDWQLVQPKLEVFEEHGAHIISMERMWTHLEFERAIMGVRFSNEFVGTQFHPEADPDGMAAHFAKKENKEKVIKNFDEEKYLVMMEHLNDPDTIGLTHRTILPGFISEVLKHKKLTSSI